MIKSIIKVVIIYITLITSNISFSLNWSGPLEGPIAQKSKKIIFIAHDLQNGGITKVYRGLQTAAKELDWKTTIVNAKGDKEFFKKTFLDSINANPDGIVITGFNTSEFKNLSELCKSKNITLIGWHSSNSEKENHDLFTNISTNSEDIAKVTTKYLLSTIKKSSAIILFSDDRYEIANEKIFYLKK